MLPTLPAPCPCLCNGLTGECLFDRRQIETCNKMIKQLLATSRCSPSFPSNCGHKLFSKFQCWLSRFSFSQCTLCAYQRHIPYSFAWRCGSLTCMKTIFRIVISPFSLSISLLLSFFRSLFSLLVFGSHLSVSPSRPPACPALDEPIIIHIHA